MRALHWLLFARSEWDLPATELAGMIDNYALLASVRLVGVVSASHYGTRPTGDGDDLLCSLSRLELSQSMWCLARQVRVLL